MIYFAYLHNRTDCRDDEVLKIEATNAKEADEIADIYCRSNFCLGKIYTRKEFKEFDPEWHRLLWRTKPISRK